MWHFSHQEPPIEIHSQLIDLSQFVGTGSQIFGKIRFFLRDLPDLRLGRILFIAIVSNEGKNLSRSVENLDKNQDCAILLGVFGRVGR
jgi:hypothetical protein